MCLNTAVWVANNLDFDQKPYLIWVYTVCSGNTFCSEGTSMLVSTSHNLASVNLNHASHNDIKMWNDNTSPVLCSGQINMSKIDEVCPLAIPNQISTILVHISSLVKIHWYCPETKIQTWRADNFVQNCPLAIPNSTISVHKPSLVKICWYLLKLSFGNENKRVACR